MRFSSCAIQGFTVNSNITQKAAERLGWEAHIQTHEEKIMTCGRKQSGWWAAKDEEQWEREGWVYDDDKFYRDAYTDNYVWTRALGKPIVTSYGAGVCRKDGEEWHLTEQGAFAVLVGMKWDLGFTHGDEHSYWNVIYENEDGDEWIYHTDKDPIRAVELALEAYFSEVEG